MSNASLLSIQNLRVEFHLDEGTLNAVNDVSLSIDKEQTLGIIGESGCGKTTAGRAILGLVKSNSGEIYFEDKTLTSISSEEMFPLRKRMQIIFHEIT